MCTIDQDGVRAVARASRRERSPFSAFSRSATRSGPRWLARDPARKKHAAKRSAAGQGHFGLRPPLLDAKFGHSIDISVRSTVRLDILMRHGIHTNRHNLVQRQARPLERRESARAGARPALRHRRLRGDACYPTADGPAIFRLDAHLERFYKSAELYDLAIPVFAGGAHGSELERRSGPTASRPSYLRPIAFFDAATLSVWTKECPVTVAIAAFPTGKYLARRRPRRARHRLADPQVRQQRDPGVGQGLRPVHQLGARGERSAAPRVRRSAAPQLAGLSRRRVGREPVRREGRRDRHQRQGRQHPDGRHARVGPGDRARPGHRRRASRTCRSRTCSSADELFFPARRSK